MPVDPSVGSLLQNIGIGLLTSDNPWAGLGRGVQSWQQLQLEDKLRQQQQSNLDRSYQMDQQRLDQQRNQFDASQEQQRAGWDREDARLKSNQDYQSGQAQLARDFQAGQAKAGRDFSAGQASLAFTRSQAAQEAQNRFAMDQLKARGALENSQWATDHYYDDQGQEGIIQTNKNGDTRYLPPGAGADGWVMGAPKAVPKPSANNFNGLPAGVITQDYKDYQTDVNAYKGLAQSVDDLEQMKGLSDKAFVGPDLYNTVGRFASKLFGMDSADAVTMLQSDSGRQQLLAAVDNMKGQGQITENERKLLAQTIADPSQLTYGAFKQVIDIAQRRAKNQMGLMDSYNSKYGGSYAPGSYGAFKGNYYSTLRSTPEGNPASGVAQSSSGNADDDLVNKYLNMP